MTSPRRRLPLALLGLLLAGTITASCDDDDHGCEPNEPCPCIDEEDCFLDCDIENCIPICQSTNRCEVECSTGCQYDCSSIRDCAVRTGPASSVRCASVNTCVATVGPGSTVDCSDLSTCDVSCSGECEVRCTRTGNPCTVRCASGAAALDCPDGRKVCDLPC